MNRLANALLNDASLDVKDKMTYLGIDIVFIEIKYDYHHRPQTGTPNKSNASHGKAF